MSTEKFTTTYEVKTENTSNERKEMNNILKPTPAFIGASWVALGIGLISYCIGLWNAEMQLSEKAKQSLLNYEWPGNIRELQHLMERAVIMADSNLISDKDFNFKRQNYNTVPNSLKVEDVEKNAIVHAINKNSGNLTKAADELGMGRSTLYRKMKKYDI